MTTTRNFTTATLLAGLGLLGACAPEADEGSAAGTEIPEVSHDFDGLTAYNPEHAISGIATAEGMLIKTSEASQMGIMLRRFGREGQLQGTWRHSPRVAGPSVEWDRQEGLLEWWYNGPQGLEQGFELATRLEGDAELFFELETDNADLELTEDGLFFTDRTSKVTLGYTKLFAVDSVGKELPSSLERIEGGLRLRVDDTDATYPIAVDPTLGYYTIEDFHILTRNGGSSYGEALAASQGLHAVGNPAANTVELFNRNGDTDTTFQTLTGSGGFGTAIAINADTTEIIVGSNTGRLYIYRRNALDAFTLHQYIDLQHHAYIGAGIVQVLEYYAGSLYVGVPHDAALGNPVLTPSGSVRILSLDANDHYVQTDRIRPSAGARLVGQSIDRRWVGAMGRVFRIIGTAGAMTADPSRDWTGDIGTCYGKQVADTGMGLILVSAPCGAGPGTVYLTRPDGSVRRTLTISTGTERDRFGESMLNIGNSYPSVYLIGAPGKVVNGLGNAGSVATYTIYPASYGIVTSIEGQVHSVSPSAGAEFGATLGAGFMEESVSTGWVRDPFNPYARGPRRKTGHSALIGGRGRVELFDFDLVAIY